MVNKGNVYWINLSKFIFISFVFLSHVESRGGYNLPILDNFYFPFFVNGFFFLSGYLLFMKQMREDAISLNVGKWLVNNKLGGGYIISNIVNKLVLPTLIFSIIIYFPKVVLRGEPIVFDLFLNETLLGGSFWFTCALSVAELFIFIMLIFRRKNSLFYILISLLLASFATYLTSKGVSFRGDMSIPWYYKSGMIATLFLSMGGLYYKHENKIDTFFSSLHAIPLILLSGVYLGVTTFLKYPSTTCVYGNINLGGFLLSISGIYCIIRLCKLARPIDKINCLGRSTLGLYFLSGAIPNTLTILLAYFGVELNTIIVLALFIVSLLMAIVVVNILNKYMPFLYNFKLLFLRNPYRK